MKKIAKLSLVAAMAVTAANAGSLEEAIKGVDVSGKLYVESYVKTSDKQNDTTDDGSTSGFEIDADIKLKNKVTDNLTAVIDIEADTDNTEENGSDSKQSLELSNAYFSYTNSGATVNVGRMDINTPNTDGEEGEGFVGMYTMGPVTAVAAHFVTNDTSAPSVYSKTKTITGAAAAADGSDSANTVVTGLMQDSDINAAALLGSVGPVNLEAWYVDVSNIADNYTYVASANVAGIDLSARYATTDFKIKALPNTKDGETIIVKAAGKVANVGLRATYYTTDKDGAALVTDPSSANAVELVNFTMANEADVDAYIVGATVPLMDKVSLALDYGTADIGKDVEESEIVAKVSYKMAKSTTLTARYADFTQEVKDAADTDKTHARLDLTYKF